MTATSAFGDRNDHMAAPFPYFGGKSRVAAEVWRRFGDVRSYVEPFFGSGAVLLGRPRPFSGPESVNDADGLLCNFWRALQSAPDEVAKHADWPVNECDLHARHLWLVDRREDITGRLMTDPEWFDARAAGWWVWGACAWIGSGWCSGDGPWVRGDDGLVKGDAGRGISRQRPHMSNAGQGVHRTGTCISEWFAALADRLRGVRVACGDWSRVIGDSVLDAGNRNGPLVAVFLDPPYAVETGRDMDCYGCTDSGAVAHDVRAWALDAGRLPNLRIALCGYDEHDELAAAGWSAFRWKTKGGFGGGRGGAGDANKHRECIWFSPACLGARQPGLFDWVGGGA